MFLTDNGGEFTNELFTEMTDMLNIVDTTTAAESPFSNGIVERHNAVLAGSIRKVLLDTKCKPSIAVSWALSAKNSLVNHNGYSPNQLAFGQNFDFPSVVTNKLPALENTCMSEKVQKHLQALHAAREGFIQSESDVRIKRALRHKIRTYSDVNFEQGDRVFFKKKDSPKWRGPGVVMGRDGSLILVRHGGLFYRVHKCHLLKEKDAEVNRCPVEEEVCVDGNAVEADGNAEPDMVTGTKNVASDNVEQKVVVNKAIKPKRNSCFKFKTTDNDAWQFSKVLYKQPKQSGQYANWLNIKDLRTGDDLCLNWDNVLEWESHDVINPAEFDHDTILIATDDDKKIHEVSCAKEKELLNLRENNVYDTVPYEGQTLISSRWVVTEKYDNGHRKIKARLVARGFEEDSSSLKIDSPTCTKESLCVLFSVSVSLVWPFMP